jgi:hypothetical protein
MLRRSTSRLFVAWALLLGCGAANLAFAQLPQPRLHAVFPPGGQAGTSFDLILTNGTDLEEISRLVFNHPGIASAAKTQDVGGKPQPIPNQFTVTLSGDVPPGQYEVRCVGLWGISNPRTFVVGNRKEAVEVEPNNTREQATPLEFNTTVNGKTNGGTDVDFYKISAKAGQRVLGEFLGRRIDSKLDGTIEVYDTAGRRLALARNNVARDPLLDFVAPADGEYFLRVYDFVYAGGEDYGYRFTLLGGPYVDFVYPPAGVAGSTAAYTLYGRNLPGGQPAGFSIYGKPVEKVTADIALPADAATLDARLTLDPSAAGIDAVPFVWNSPNGLSNSVPVGFANSPVAVEVEPNNLAAQAQKIAVPAELAGQFQSKADVDLYQFEAKAQQVLWIEVQGQRLGTGADPYLTLDQVTVNDKGEESLKRIAAVDDEGANLLPNVFDTLHDDPVYKFTVPADGNYRLSVRDRYAASRGDPSLVYRLTIREEQPDFRLVTVPTMPTPPNQRQAQTWSVDLRRGDNVAVAVLALRRDGFVGDITVTVDGLPPGVTCRDISIGANPSVGTLVFVAAEDAPPWAGTIRVTGQAKIENGKLVAALTAAQAVQKTASEALAAADKTLQKPNEELQKATEALTAAKTELAAKPDDEELKKKVAEAETKLAAATQAQQTAAQARAAADQKVQEAVAAVQQADQARAAAAKDVTRVARTGTVVWNGQQNVPGDARVSQALELSVIEEPAPFQLVTEVHRVVAHHNRQILVPVKLIKRAGFDANVALTFAGQPQNVQVENKPINKDKPEEVFRVFVPPNAAAGTYVMYLAGQAQVSYRRNPAKQDRAKVEFDAATALATAATEAQKTATTTRDAAIKAVADSQAALKQATEAKAAADKALVDAQAAEKAAEQAVKDAGDNADAKAAAEKKLQDALVVTKAAQDAVTTTEKTRVDADAAVKTTEQAKVTAENELKAADEKIKATTAEKAASEKRFKDAETATKAQNINFLPTTTPIVLTIKPAPVTLTANVPDGGNLKQGAKLEVKVDVKRQNGFAGPVTLTLPLPPGVVGVKAEPVMVPADQTAGVLVVEAAADAPEAALANMVVRVVAQFEGEAAVDQPVALKVVK